MFYLTRAPKWAEEAEVLGLDPAQIALLQTRIEAAREAFNAQRQALASARSKTQALQFALDAMNTQGAGIIQQIRGRSATLGNKAYILALIAKPEKPSPIAPPGTPSGFDAQVTQIGSVILRWQCDNPHGSRGTIYHLHRRIGAPGGQWDFIGTAGRKEFEDATLPAGVAQVCYRVQAFRSTAAGQVAEHVMNFGGIGRGLPMPGSIQLAKRKRERRARRVRRAA